MDRRLTEMRDEQHLPPRRGGRRELTAVQRWVRTAILLIATPLLLAGCEGLVDVENPNNVLQEDVEKPTAATALVSGAYGRLMIASGWVLRVVEPASDEFDWAGSWDASRDIHQGNWWDPGNPDANDAFNSMAVARWMADETLDVVQGFADEGTLPNEVDLIDAQLFVGLTRLMIGEWFEDFTFSNRMEDGPPIGEENMDRMFDEAQTHLGQARELARQAGDVERERQAVALQARAHWSRAVWHKLQPRGTQPADPLVRDQQAQALAEELLALTAGEPDWRYSFEFTPGVQTNNFGTWANERTEVTPGHLYVTHDASGRSVESVHMTDPIDGIVDPALSRLVWEFVNGFRHPPLIVTSAREMHLILAEHALAGGDDATFRTHINAVRALESGTSPYEGQIPAMEMLRHSRRVNLWGMGRRLHDHFRFGTQSPGWLHNSFAITRPGSFLPIGEEERLTNCYLLGTC